MNLSAWRKGSSKHVFNSSPTFHLRSLRSWQSTASVSVRPSSPSHPTHCHRSPICLGIHRLALFRERGQQLKIIDVIGGRVRVEEHSIFIERVLKSVRAPCRYSHEVALFGVDYIAVQPAES